MTRRVHPHTDLNADLKRSPRSSFPGLTAAPVPMPETKPHELPGRSGGKAEHPQHLRGEGGSLFWGGKAWGGQPRAGAAPRGSGQGSSRQRALQGRGTALPARGTPAQTPGQPQLLQMEIGVNHCLLLFKAFALLQFHHILNSWAAHAASQLLDLEGRQPHTPTAGPKQSRHVALSGGSGSGATRFLISMVEISK